MQLRALVAAALVGLGYSAGSCASSLDIGLSNHSIAANYGTSVGSSAEFTAGGLYNRDSNDWFADAGLLARGESRGQNSRTEIGVGGKLYGATADNQNLLALGLGADVRWFPGDGPIGIGGYGFYAPNVVTAVDGKNFWEAGARVEWEIVRNTASVFIGYRKAHANFDNGQSTDIEKGGFAGMRVSF